MMNVTTLWDNPAIHPGARMFRLADLRAEVTQRIIAGDDQGALELDAALLATQIGTQFFPTDEPGPIKPDCQ